jgi:hypothetical protein
VKETSPLIHQHHPTQHRPETTRDAGFPSFLSFSSWIQDQVQNAEPILFREGHPAANPVTCFLSAQMDDLSDQAHLYEGRVSTILCQQISTVSWGICIKRLPERPYTPMCSPRGWRRAGPSSLSQMMDSMTHISRSATRSKRLRPSSGRTAFATQCSREKKTAEELSWQNTAPGMAPELHGWACGSCLRLWKMPIWRPWNTCRASTSARNSLKPLPPGREQNQHQKWLLCPSCERRSTGRRMPSAWSLVTEPTIAVPSKPCHAQTLTSEGWHQRRQRCCVRGPLK